MYSGRFFSVIPRIAERLALRRIIGVPYGWQMRGRARQHLKTLRQAQLGSEEDLYLHKDMYQSCGGAINLASDALEFLLEVGENDYAAVCLAYIAHGDADPAFYKPLIDLADPDDPDFDKDIR